MTVTTINLPKLSTKERGLFESRAIPSSFLPIAGQKDATYKMALLLVARIDEDLARGVSHYRTRAGELLTTLDQIVVAILNNDLLEPEA